MRVLEPFTPVLLAQRRKLVQRAGGQRDSHRLRRRRTGGQSRANRQSGLPHRTPFLFLSDCPAGSEAKSHRQAALRSQKSLRELKLHKRILFLLILGVGGALFVRAYLVEAVAVASGS